MKPMSKRRRTSILVLGALIILPSLAYGWARLSTSSSGLARAIVWMDADVRDYTRFPARTMLESEQPLTFETREVSVDFELDTGMPGEDLDSFLKQTQTAAFIAIRDDEVIAERYYNGYNEASTVTSFSVAKSFISALIGIALEDGAIGSVDDPVTRYLSELEERDRRFADITIHHLLTMSSGLRFEEQGLPWSDDAKTYYATDLRTLALEDTEILEPPGRNFHYNPYNTLLLGLILERATGERVSDFMQDELWQPMGAVAPGTWSLDSHESGFEKMESGLNGRAIDLAKLGLLYLHDGTLNGHAILSEAWVRESTRYAEDSDPSRGYQYQWWIYRDPSFGGWYLARGNKGQFIAVFPEHDLVIARFGIDFGYEDWTGVLPRLAQAYAGA